MSLSRCGRLARLSLAGARPVVATPRVSIARSIPLVRGVSSNSRDAQQKVGFEFNGILNGRLDHSNCLFSFLRLL